MIKRLWYPAVLLVIWHMAAHYLPQELAMPIMVASAFLLGGSIFYVVGK